MEDTQKKKTDITLRKPRRLRRARLAELAMCAPIVLWSVLFIIAPMIILIFMSFMTKGTLGRVQYKFTLDNYAQIVSPVYTSTAWQSLVIAFWTTLLTVLIGYPFAFLLTKLRRKVSRLLIIVIMMPLWVSGLVILYSFVILLNNSGVLNTILMRTGITKAPLQLLYNNAAVIAGMIYMFLPLAILPMHASISKLDPSLVEASKDLGAGPVRTFFCVTLPQTAPGIFAAVILTFIPCIGYYMVTDMLGGGTTMMFGNLIYRQFTIARNWPFGAAVSVVLGAVILLMVWIYTKVGGSLDDL